MTRSKIGKKHIDIKNKKLDEYYNTLPFEELPKKRRRKILIKEQRNKCKICGINQWSNQPITLECDHIDGDHSNNKKENLRMICPNCHSQTSNWRGRNKQKGVKVIDYIEEKDILGNIPNFHNRSELLKFLGLKAAGSNYGRINKILNENPNVQFKVKTIHDDCPVCGSPKKIKNKFCSTHCSNVSRRKVNWPDHQTLKKLVTDNGYVKTGKMFNVSDNAVRKRIKWGSGEAG